MSVFFTTPDRQVSRDMELCDSRFFILPTMTRRTSPRRTNCRCHGVTAVAFSLALLTVSKSISCNSFVIPQTRIVPSSTRSNHHLFSTVARTDETKTNTKPISSYTLAEISEAQSNAERYARSIHDNYAMNALFVNVPERSTPTPCSFASSDSGMSSLPHDLPPGCLLRIGPNGASTEEGFLDGDGMAHCITLPPPSSGGSETDDASNDQNIMYSATYVQTKGRKLERARRIKISKIAAKSRFSGRTSGTSTGRNPVSQDVKFKGTLGAAPEGLPMLSSLLRNGLTFGTLDVQKDTCNTALAVSGSRVLALMEQSPPSEIQFTKGGRMRTVESMCRLDGAVPVAPINGGSMGAHGRTDPSTGERVHVSYNSNARPFVRVDTFGDDWRLKSSVGVDVPAPVMVHDCALTENYTIILDFPLTIRPRRFLANAFPVEYEPENGARIGLTPRRGEDSQKDRTVWIDVESGVVLHAANAFENKEDGTIVVHAFKSIPGGEASYILDYTPAFLYEWVLDPKAGKVVKERCLNPNVMVEFPQIPDELEGKEAPYVYGLVSTSIGGPMLQFKTPQVGVLLDSVVKLALTDDAETGLVAGDVASRFDLPLGWHSVSEPTVVTKTGKDGHYVLLVATYVPPSDDVNKGDHVKVATDGKSMKSQFLVLDGDYLSNGPVTTVDLPYHVNYGLHSMLLDWDKMT